MNPLSLATEGHLSLDDCKVLSLATVGHLGCVDVVVRPPEPELPGRKSSGSRMPELTEYIEDVFLELDYTEDLEEEEILLIIKMFLKCL